MWLLWQACGGATTPGLSEEAVTARVALAHALEGRDPIVVGAAAKTAAKWENQDADLDILLGDALANVLMRPTDGLQLLEARKTPDDPTWARAYIGAVMRQGDPEKMAAIWSTTKGETLDFTHPVAQQVADRLRRDPSLAPERVAEAVTNCTLLDGQPSVGRQVLDLPASSHLLEAAKALGLTRVVLGRPAWRSDADPFSGRGPLHCRNGVLLEGGWPDPMPRALVLGATDGLRRVYIDVKLEKGEPWCFASSDAKVAARWVNAALALAGGADALPPQFDGGLWGGSGGQP